MLFLAQPGRYAEDVRYRVLAIAVRADHALAGVVALYVAEPGLERLALAPVGGVADHGSPHPTGVVKYCGEARATAVVDHQDDQAGIRVEQILDECRKFAIGLVWGVRMITVVAYCPM